VEDLYQVLRISPNATREEVVSAYKRVALQTHPDKSPSDEEFFKKATEAYTILRDPEKRSKYDKKFNYKKFNSTKTVIRQGKDIRVTLRVSLEDLVHEVTKTIITTRRGICPACQGTGSKDKKTDKCRICNGSGINPISPVIGMRISCEACQGIGHIPSGKTCFSCSGTGLINEEIQRSIHLNPHFPGNVVIPSSGHCHPNGDPGNLIIEVLVKKDPIYELHGLNIYRSLEISPVQAILGDVVEIYLFNRTLSIKIPPGTQHDTVIEIKNEGALCEHKKGNLFIRMKIITPKFISKEARALYEKILGLEGSEEIIHG